MPHIPDFPSEETEDESVPNPTDIIDRIINGGDNPVPSGD